MTMIWNAEEGFVDKLVDKYTNGEKFEKNELDNFYYVESDKIIVCYNVSGDCYIDEYDSIEEIKEDLEMDDVVLESYSWLNNLLNK